jgi:hypothetical protein
MKTEAWGAARLAALLPMPQMFPTFPWITLKPERNPISYHAHHVVVIAPSPASSSPRPICRPPRDCGPATCR